MNKYNKIQVFERRLQYIINCISRRPVYSFSEQALIEEKRCIRDRKLSIHSEKMRRLKTELDSNNKVLSRVCLSVTNQCSLNCEKCNNLMPYSKDKYFVSLEDIKKDISKILNCLDRIVNVEVIGGEPFLYRELYELIWFLSNQDKIDWIEITTNATVIPKDEQWEKLKIGNVIVKCSDYGDVNHTKLQEFLRQAKLHGVRCISLNNTVWYDPGGIKKRNRSRIHNKYNYFHCEARKDCKTLYKGKLYMCGRTPILDEIILDDKTRDYVNLREYFSEQALWNSIDEFYHRRFAECCDYCDCSDDKVQVIKSGAQCERKKYE